jgi:hypothetical protein
MEGPPFVPGDSSAEEERVTPVPGIFVAHHNWFGAEASQGQICAVGHTGDLRRCADDAAFVKFFSEGFTLAKVIELPSQHVAALVEAGVLFCASDFRLTCGSLGLLARQPSNLLCMPPGDVAALASAVAAQLGFAGHPRDRPLYQLPPRPEVAAAPGGPSADIRRAPEEPGNCTETRLLSCEQRKLLGSLTMVAANCIFPGHFQGVGVADQHLAAVAVPRHGGVVSKRKAPSPPATSNPVLDSSAIPPHLNEANLCALDVQNKSSLESSGSATSGKMVGAQGPGVVIGKVVRSCPFLRVAKRCIQAYWRAVRTLAFCDRVSTGTSLHPAQRWRSPASRWPRCVLP